MKPFVSRSSVSVALSAALLLPQMAYSKEIFLLCKVKTEFEIPKKEIKEYSSRYMINDTTKHLFWFSEQDNEFYNYCIDPDRQVRCTVNDKIFHMLKWTGKKPKDVDPIKGIVIHGMTFSRWQGTFSQSYDKESKFEKVSYSSTGTCVEESDPRIREKRF